MKSALDRWASMGRLSPGKSKRLEALVQRAARRERVRRRILWIPAPVAVAVALIWTLFTAPATEPPWQDESTQIADGGETTQRRVYELPTSENVAVHVVEAGEALLIQVEVMVPLTNEELVEHVPLR